MEDTSTTIKIEYLSSEDLPKTRDAYEYEYTYKIIEKRYSESVFDAGNSKIYRMKVAITGPLLLI